MKRIKGFVTYIYRGIQYFEQPRNTHISKIEYDENENMSTVYLKHNTILIESLCVIILCFLVYFVYSNGKFSQVVHIPDSTYYYDNKLYVNMVADERNTKSIGYTIAGTSGELCPGESLEYVDYTYENQTIETISYYVDIFGINKDFTKDITVGILEFEDGGLYDEGY